jgi:hypothetical protein
MSTLLDRFIVYPSEPYARTVPFSISNSAHVTHSLESFARRRRESDVRAADIKLKVKPTRDRRVWIGEKRGSLPPIAWTVRMTKTQTSG